MASIKKPKVAAVRRKRGSGAKRPAQLEGSTAAAQPPNTAPPAAIVGIGASAGGIEAFTSVLKELPPDTGLAFVFVQHLAPTHVSMLAEILQRATRMRVLEVHDEPTVERNCVYVIPPARGMVFKDGRLELTPRGQPPHHPVDDFFDSLAVGQGHRAIGVVLSGTASDGTAGLAAIKAAGGITMAQDSTAQYDGMPRSAITAGRVDFVLPPAGIARELARIAHHPYVTQPAEAAGAEVSNRVLFENPAPAAVQRERAARPRRAAAARSGELEEKDKQINRLLQELSATRDYLQSVIEQQEAANEELQSATEELQSINEELETSREEIQSSNEELTTVNEELQNRNEELNRVNNDLNNLFDSLQMAIVIVWQDLRIRRFTPMAEKLFNLIATDIGRPIGDIKLNLTVQDLPKLLAQVIDQVTARDLEVQDQAGRWYQLRVRPYRTLDNHIDGAVILLFDIDSMKQSQGVLERQAKLLEQTHEAVFVRELGGTIVYWNRGAELMYGFSKEEAVGRSSHELLGKAPAARTQINEALQSEGRWMGEIVHRTKDGRELVVESLEVLIAEGERRMVLSTNRDVTERKRLEETLHRRVDELAAADRHKSEFLAVLAHELRNPLAPLRNAIEILKAVPPGDPRCLRAQELIERQTRTLTRLVDDLLDTSRISRGQVQLRREIIDLQAVVSRAVETARAAVDSRRHVLSVDVPQDPILVNGDATRLEQVLANLLHNAAKYTPDGGQITVSLQRQSEEGSEPQAILRVRDNGIGIAPQMLPRVFDLFTQADHSLAHSQGGLGIGLSLVRSLVELHGGRVEVSSEGLGKGSEFRVRLPLAPRP